MNEFEEQYQYKVDHLGDPEEDENEKHQYANLVEQNEHGLTKQ